MPAPDSLTFYTSDVSENDMYKLMIGSVVPRPIAWVSSMSANGILNLAPSSFFIVSSRNPPTLLISIGPGVDERKGTDFSQIELCPAFSYFPKFCEVRND